MRTVYSLKEELDRDPERIRTVQAMSLNKDKPFLGLNPRQGLYGSDEWWADIASGKIQSACYSGVIVRLYHAGMDGDRTKPNSFEMKTDDNRRYDHGTIVNDPSQKSLYTVGRRIEVRTIFLETKRNGMSEQPFEIAIQRRAPTESGE